MPSLSTLKNLIGLNWDRFVAAIQRVQPKVYNVLITQAGTAAPTVKVLENTLGATVVWARTSAGLYTGTLASAFTADKTSLVVGGQMAALNRATLVRTSANVITLTTNVLSESSNVLIATATDAIITDLAIEVTVYP